MKTSTKLLDLEWKTGPVIKNHQKLINFLTLINEFNQYDEFIAYVKAYRELPEFCYQNRLAEWEKKRSTQFIHTACAWLGISFGSFTYLMYKDLMHLNVLLSYGRLGGKLYFFLHDCLRSICRGLYYLGHGYLKLSRRWSVPIKLSSELNTQSLSYFAEIDSLSNDHSLKALKLTIILFCHEENFKQSKSFIGKLKSTVHSYFFLDTIPLETRLNLCILCVHNWPFDRNDNFSAKNLFFNILPELFIQYAKIEPEKALSLFEKKFPENGNYFFSSCENREKFLEFSLYFMEEHPQKYLGTLCDYLRNAHSFKYPEDTVKKISQKLYEISNDPKYMSILHANSHHYAKLIYKTLLKHAYPDEVWYPNLAYSLWEIERNNTERDSAFLNYCCIIAVNAPDNFSHINEICEKYLESIFFYKSVQNDEYEMEKFTDRVGEKFIELLNHSLGNYHWYRNYYIDVTNISKACKPFMDTIICAYWDMVDWLYKNNLVAYFYALKVGIQNDSRSYCEITKNIASEAEKLLFEHIGTLINTRRDEAINLIAKTIGDSMYSNYKKNLYPFLDRLLPAIIQLDPGVAKEAVQKGINYQSHDRQWPWRPHDLKTNPVYEGITEPKIHCL